MNFLDESGEIRATAFKAEVDKFFNLIEVNKVCFLFIYFSINYFFYH